MMRALWTAASGMTSQQINVDTISNNLANVNTIGYKKERLEFKSLLYETIQKPYIDANGQGRPVGLQIGHGVQAAAISKEFSVGDIERTDRPVDFALLGQGFFVVKSANGENYYTKDGTFKVSLVEDNLRLSTTEGFYLQDINGEPLEIPGGINIEQLKVDSAGNMSYIDNNGDLQQLDVQINVVQFKNPFGLNFMGKNFYTPSTSSGDPILETQDDTLKKTEVIQGSLENSNVQAVEEMVKLIVAQRAYELSSKAIQSADEMLGQANNLKR